MASTLQQLAAYRKEYCGLDWKHKYRMQKAAEKRSAALFLSMLSPHQRKQFDKFKYFVVKAPSGNRYQIRTNSQSGNIILLGKLGRRWYCKEKWCVHLAKEQYQRGRWGQSVPVPKWDSFIAQMLLIQTDEASLRKKANRDETTEWVDAVWRTEHSGCPQCTQRAEYESTYNDAHYASDCFRHYSISRRRICTKHQHGRKNEPAAVPGSQSTPSITTSSAPNSVG